jgi:hypothetical protein
VKSHLLEPRGVEFLDGSFFVVDSSGCWDDVDSWGALTSSSYSSSCWNCWNNCYCRNRQYYDSTEDLLQDLNHFVEDVDVDVDRNRKLKDKSMAWASDYRRLVSPAQKSFSETYGQLGQCPLPLLTQLSCLI